MIKKIFTNTFYQMLGKLFTMLVTIATTVIIAKTYGRESYGYFNLMQAWPALVFIIVDFGFNAIATREISRDQSKAGAYLSTILVLRFWMSLVAIITMTGLLQLMPYSQELRNGVRLNLFLILTQALYATTNVIFQPKLRYDLATIGNALGYVYIFIAVVVMSSLRFPVAVLSANYIIGGVITVIFNLWAINKLGVPVKFVLDKVIAKDLFVKSLPLGLMFIFSQINFKIDSIFISAFKLPQNIPLTNAASVAVYGLAYKIFEVSLAVPTYFMNSIYPVFVIREAQEKAAFAQTFKKTLLMLGSLGVVLGILGVLFSPLAIRLLGGPEFSLSVVVLQVLLGGIFLYFLTQPIAWLLVTLDRQRYLPYVYFISAAFNITANLIFIPKYSFYASMLITHASEFLILLMLIFFAKKAWKEKYA